jgi:aryl-alcohol dehydrogenase-like predicted oxidoreductase
MKVSELGFGGWGIGGDWWSGADDKESIEALELAKDLGINFFDSAVTYGNGHSESLIGQVVKAERDKYIVTTKIPPKNFVFPAEPGSKIEDTYPPDWIIETTENSLKSFDLEYIDLQHFHVWINDWTDSEELLKVVEKLKKDGKIRALGVSINFPYSKTDNAIPGMESGLFDVVQVVYNIYQQEPENDVFPAADKYNVGVVSRCILDEGALTGKITSDTRFPEGSFLDGYFKDNRKEIVDKKAKELMWLVEEGHTETLAEAATRFAISNPVVSSAIAGMRNPKHAKANCEAAVKGPLPKEVLERLKKHAWHHNYWV